MKIISKLFFFLNSGQTMYKCTEKYQLKENKNKERTKKLTSFIVKRSKLLQYMYVLLYPRKYESQVKKNKIVLNRRP